MRDREADKRSRAEKDARRAEEAGIENDIYTNELLKEILRQLKETSRPAKAIGGKLKASMFESGAIQSLPHPEDTKDLPEAQRNEIERMRKEGVKNKSLGGRVGNIGRWAQERGEGFAGAADNTLQRGLTQGIVNGVSGGVSMIGRGISKRWGVNFDEKLQHKTEQQKSPGAEKSKEVGIKLDSDTKKAISSIDTNVQQIAKSVKSIDDLMVENSLDRMEREKEASQDLKEVGVTRTKFEETEANMGKFNGGLIGMIDAIDDVMDILKFFKKGKGGGLSIPGTAGGGFGAGGFGDASDEILDAPDAKKKGPKKPGKVGRFKNIARAVLGRGKGLAVRGAGMLARGAIMGAPAAAVATAGYAGYKAGEYLNENTDIQENIANGIEKTGTTYDAAVNATSMAMTDSVEGAKNVYNSAVDTTSRGIESGVNWMKNTYDSASETVQQGANAVSKGYSELENNVSNAATSVSDTVKGGYQAAVAATSSVIETGAKAWDSATKNFGASESVAQVIKQAAEKVGVDYGTLMAFAKQESGFNPNAKAKTSSATGLFQFIKGTWGDMVRKYGKQYGIGMGDVSDPLANATMGALFVKENSDFLARKGIPVNGTSLYAAHFLGPGGAAKLFGADPSANAAELMPKAASANRAIFYDKAGNPKSVEGVIQTLFNKVGKNVDAFSAAAKEAEKGGASATASSPSVSGGSGGTGVPSRTPSSAQAAGAAKMSTNTTAASVKTSSSPPSSSGGSGGSGGSSPSTSTAKSSSPGAVPGPTRNQSQLKTLQANEMNNRII